MSRIRSIKPEFWTSAQVMECSTNARLLFIGLWNFCDDAGRHPDSPKQLKAEIFPADELSLSTIQGMIDELSTNGLITRYKVRDTLYIQVDGWHHQRIDKPQKPRYPDQKEADAAPNPEPIPRTIDDHSRLIRREGIREEGIGRDTNTAAAQRAAEDDGDLEFEALRAVYPKRSGDHRWHEARKAINARLAEGHTWEQILDGARRYAEWCRITGKIGTETVKQAATFVGPGKPFLEAFTPPLTKADTRMMANGDAFAEAEQRLFGAA